MKFIFYYCILPFWWHYFQSVGCIKIFEIFAFCLIVEFFKNFNQYWNNELYIILIIASMIQLQHNLVINISFISVVTSKMASFLAQQHLRMTLKIFLNSSRTCIPSTLHQFSLIPFLNAKVKQMHYLDYTGYRCFYSY